MFTILSSETVCRGHFATKNLTPVVLFREFSNIFTITTTEILELYSLESGNTKISHLFNFKH